MLGIEGVVCLKFGVKGSGLLDSEQSACAGSPGAPAQTYWGNLFVFSLTSAKLTTQFILTSNIKTFV